MWYEEDGVAKPKLTISEAIDDFDKKGGFKPIQPTATEEKETKLAVIGVGKATDHNEATCPYCKRDREKEKEQGDDWVSSFINVYVDEYGKFISNAEWATYEDAFNSRGILSTYHETVEIRRKPQQ